METVITNYWDFIKFEQEYPQEAKEWQQVNKDTWWLLLLLAFYGEDEGLMIFQREPHYHGAGEELLLDILDKLTPTWNQIKRRTSNGSLKGRELDNAIRDRKLLDALDRMGSGKQYSKPDENNKAAEKLEAFLEQERMNERPS